MNLAPANAPWLDLVRKEMGEWLPDSVAGYILWNETAFPFADVDYVRQQVREFRDSHGARQ